MHEKTGQNHRPQVDASLKQSYRRAVRACRNFRSIATATILLFLASSLHKAESSQPVSEYQLKAAYLGKFPAFIKWPQPELTGAATEVNVCIFGEDPFKRAIDQLAEQKIDARRISVTTLGKNLYIEKCNVLYISASERDRLDTILDALGKQPLLTVSDIADFSQQGGMIGFVTRSDHSIRFEVNLRAARQAGLEISARLLGIAVKVYQ